VGAQKTDCDCSERNTCAHLFNSREVDIDRKSIDTITSHHD